MGFNIADLKTTLVKVSAALIESKDLLTHIDNLSGDGDLGISMEKAAYSILQELDKPNIGDIASLLSNCAVSININAPSTMGTLTSFSIMEAAKIMRWNDEFSDSELLNIPLRMVETIMIHGRAQRGDKTVLDALIPYAEALNEVYRAERDIRKAAECAADAAAQAAKATKGCIAKIGRAKWIAERSRDCPDGGAVVCAIVVNTIVDRKFEVDVS